MNARERLALVVRLACLPFVFGWFCLVGWLDGCEQREADEDDG